jgi:galactokinase/mevalonate kinase-like predicted kinase
MIAPAAPGPLAGLQDELRDAWSARSGLAERSRSLEEAFARLRRLLISQAQLVPVAPRLAVKDDQIVWARSPVRLDLAGGWTDTPPYCLEHGGRVVNLAVDLNGQPPIEVFVRPSARLEIVLRSIDLGLQERVHSFRQLDAFERFDSSFALAKCALALAGFLPRFHRQGQFASLPTLLREFGGGVELSLVSAVPKGSGLGTSSILAATVLCALSRFCGLDWPREVILDRTLALEQLMTTGGGWQDQAGALYRGLKLIETQPGLGQRPTVRWLPTDLFGPDFANRRALLFYTGLTRLAKDILRKIVGRMFLKSAADLEVLGAIGDNAVAAAEAIQKCDYGLLAASVRESWALNQRLDAGTNPPEVQRMLSEIGDYLAAAKLLGAGGGGYLLLLAKDELAAARIRSHLTANPPNRLSRLVSFAVSGLGTQTTQS